MRKFSRAASSIVVSIFLLTLISSNAAYSLGLDISMQRKSGGVVGVKVSGASNKRLQIGVYASEKDETYFLPYRKDDAEIDVPLMFGNGKYVISLFEEINNNYYSPVDSYAFDFQLRDYEDVYLSSSVIVPWRGAEKTVAKAAELTAGIKGDSDKFYAIYKYITENVRYDISKETEAGYRSRPDATLEDGSGICLDLAVLLASMARSSGVKCKLVYGYAYGSGILHSWNEVYVKRKWIVVDPTMDSHCFVSRIPYSYSKKAADYESVYSF